MSSLCVSLVLFSHIKTGSKGQDYMVEWEFKVKLDVVSVCQKAKVGGCLGNQGCIFKGPSNHM